MAYWDIKLQNWAIPQSCIVTAGYYKSQDLSTLVKGHMATLVPVIKSLRCNAFGGALAMQTT
jgi:hypothetical protein